jgi:hypothetical protein
MDDQVFTSDKPMRESVAPGFAAMTAGREALLAKHRDTTTNRALGLQPASLAKRARKAA